MFKASVFAGVILTFVACSPAEAPPSRSPSAASTTPASDASPPASASAPAPSKAGPPGAMCGGIAGFGCAAGGYCSFPLEAMCGAADQSGTCVVVPEMCAEEYAPVCGCDDKTYPNACHAARASVSVGRQGECPAPAAAASLADGATCGTRGVAGECGPDSYCAFRRACGDDDSGGICTARPKMCTKIYAPVCGCDGKTHPSACTAAAAGVSVRTTGACAGNPG